MTQQLYLAAELNVTGKRSKQLQTLNRACRILP